MGVLLSAELAMGGQLAPGWLEIEDSRLIAAEHGPPPREPDERADGILTAGLCDLQVNGAAGCEVSGGRSALDAIDAAQLASGVTSYLPALVSPDSEIAARVLPELARRAADPLSPVAGVHLEGPFLSREHAGMHPRERLRSPAEGIPDWIEHPVVRLVTIAPELPGALDLIARLSARGIAVALGHSGASSEVGRAAIDAGARLVTHVFNAMAPFDHHSPGLIGLALVDERLHVSVIADGVHVHPVALELIRRTSGRRVLLITDATPAAAAPPGRYVMAGVPIEASGGAARTSAGVLAGSIMTLDQAVCNWATMTRATLAEALFAANEAAAVAAGLRDVAVVGAAANLVLLGPSGGVRRVMRAGRWLDQKSA